VTTDAIREQDRARGERHKVYWTANDPYDIVEWKRCHKCATDRPRRYFALNRRRSDGLQQYCKPCHAALQRETFAQARAGAEKIYGAACAECGRTSDLEFDHVNNDGHEHRQQESVVSMYRRIVAAGAPLEDRELQLLCQSCHLKKTSKQRRGWIERLRAECYEAGYRAARQEMGLD
jgi:5-methylcytosine-specific restriction endonuclease McrA